MGRAESRPQERHGRLSFAARRPAAPPPPASSPPPFRFRPAGFARAWQAGACALGVLAAVLVLLLGAETAQAQTSKTLVSNTGQANALNDSFFNDHAQAFTTGAATAYRLTDAAFVLRQRLNDSDPSYSVKIHSDSSNRPGTVLATLDKPARLNPNNNFETVKFSVPDGGINLKPSTKYWVVLDVSGGTDSTGVQRTNSGAEDSGVEAGWSIANTGLNRCRSGCGWASVIPRKIAIYGYVIDTDAGDDVTVRAGARVALDGTGSRVPSGSTYAWTQTAGPAVTLDDAASTTPAFVAPSVSTSTDLTFSLTVAVGEVSVADTVTVTVEPSRVVSASVDNDALTVTFDSALDTTSRPASSAFTVTATKSGSSRTILGTGAAVKFSNSNKTVTAALESAVTADERLTVPFCGLGEKDDGRTTNLVRRRVGGGGAVVAASANADGVGVRRTTGAKPGDAGVRPQARGTTNENPNWLA